MIERQTVKLDAWYLQRYTSDGRAEMPCHQSLAVHKSFVGYRTEQFRVNKVTSGDAFNIVYIFALEDIDEYPKNYYWLNDFPPMLMFENLQAAYPAYNLSTDDIVNARIRRTAKYW